MGAGGAKADLKSLGVIRGTSVIASGSTVVKELKYKVIVPLQELSADNLRALSMKELSTKSAAFGQIRQSLSAAERYLVEYEQFTSLNNLQAFRVLQNAIPPKSRWISRLNPIFDALTGNIEDSPQAS